MRLGLEAVEELMNNFLEDNVPNLSVLYEIAQEQHPTLPTFQELLQQMDTTQDNLSTETPMETSAPSQPTESLSPKSEETLSQDNQTLS